MNTGGWKTRSWAGGRRLTRPSRADHPFAVGFAGASNFYPPLPERACPSRSSPTIMRSWRTSISTRTASPSRPRNATSIATASLIRPLYAGNLGRTRCRRRNRLGDRPSLSQGMPIRERLRFICASTPTTCTSTTIFYAPMRPTTPLTRRRSARSRHPRSFSRHRDGRWHVIHDISRDVVNTLIELGRGSAAPRLPIFGIATISEFSMTSLLEPGRRCPSAETSNPT